MYIEKAYYRFFVSRPANVSTVDETGPAQVCMNHTAVELLMNLHVANPRSVVLLYPSFTTTVVGAIRKRPRLTAFKHRNVILPRSRMIHA